MINAEPVPAQQALRILEDLQRPGADQFRAKLARRADHEPLRGST